MKTNNSVDQEALRLELQMKQVVSNYFAAAKTYTDHAPITTRTGDATHTSCCSNAQHRYPSADTSK